ncbi:hypothetical protein [Calothrix sp. FACHB-168]|uniref:hypothetical protein n=1 Tax=Calothrix sp. FACHB-168 TaxID=2692780 RepID=UPI001687662C|nr:hypothetical protein [Calothrix sp. FACHB-168]MBD2208121.1 hypothetical protein [Calothrix sp. FACHB-168]
MGIKRLRLTISTHHKTYLEAIASQMGCDCGEALNYLLWELRKSNYQFGASIPHYNQDTFEKFKPQSPQAIQEFETTQELHQQIDPIIARMALLVDDF